MTTKQTLQALQKSGKPICLSHFYRLAGLLKIRPLGRSRPQQYPQDTAEKILIHLGFPAGAMQTVHGSFYDPAPQKLISVRALRAARKNKTKGTK